MLSDFIKYSSLDDSVTISENFHTVKLELSLKKSMKETVLKFFDELKTISPRDSFEFFLDICGNHVSITNTSHQGYLDLLQHIEDNDEEDSYSIELNIRKKHSDNTRSIYFIDKFIEFIQSSSLIDLIKTLSDDFENFVRFEVFSTFDACYSSGIIFYQHGDETNNIATIDRKSRNEQRELFEEASNNSEITYGLVPSDFRFIKDSNIPELNSIFESVCAAIALTFISNTAHYVGNSISYKINGYKTICCEGVKIQELRKFCNLVYKIYAWAYEGGNSSDKIGLVRNVLSIHLDNDGNIKFDGEVWEAIRSNYQVYLRENIQSYLEVKNKIGEVVIESTSKTYAMADDLLDAVKNNVFVLLTFFLTVVLVNGLKDNGIENIFSVGYLVVVLIICVVSAIWMMMVSMETINRYDSATSTIKEIVRVNYNKIIMDSEIDDTVNPIIEKNKNYLKDQIKRYQKWCFSILTIFFLSFSVASFFLHFNVVPNDNASKENVDLIKGVVSNSSDTVKSSSSNTLHDDKRKSSTNSQDNK
ncbi:hypothetical protein KZY42_003933 [Vibrio vulnificus]|nr:hypothetical protein [Vibrio vulnificus]HAS6108348.1 hypothetical protein [Vibrio vulnificus]HAS6112412.1 hypothetical protein [Vibrio vulnificus]HAS6293514.1 hypothetical protein [Vibrio vulnificus]HAS6316708.1 hypothetical protein [Vibrio vulnificus]